MKQIILLLTRFLYGDKFTGLYDADNRPLFEGDEYVVFTHYNPKTQCFCGDTRTYLGGKGVCIKIVEYSVRPEFGNAGYSIPRCEMVEKVIDRKKFEPYFYEKT